MIKFVERMKTDIVICLLIGVPGAGKTTLAKKLIKINEQNTKCEVKFLTLSFDEFFFIKDQEKLVTKTKANGELKAFKDIRAKFEESVINTVTSLRTGEKVENCTISSPDVVPLQGQKYALVLDDNFYFKSMRYKFFQMSRNFNCGFCQVYLQCSEDLAKKRNCNRSETVPEEVIHTMNTKIEEPSSCSWEDESIIIPSQEIDLSLQAVYNLILGNFEKGLTPLEDETIRKKEAQSLNMNSLLHRSDLILRTLVGEKMKALKQITPSKDLLKSKFDAVNSLRQNLLAKLSNETLLVPLCVFEEEKINVCELHTFLKAEFQSLCTDVSINS